jgi:Ring finger domain
MSEPNILENRVIDLTSEEYPNRMNMSEYRTILRDLTSEEQTNRVHIPNNSHIFNPVRGCSFCKCAGHNIRTCNHADIEKLDKCARFMYITTVSYLRNEPTTEKTHKMWLDNLSMSEYRILVELNRLGTNSRMTRKQYQEKLHAYYVQYAENETQNDAPTNITTFFSRSLLGTRRIINIYSSNLLRRIPTNHFHDMEYAWRDLDRIIKNSGRHLLDMPRFRYWLNNNMRLHYRIRDEIYPRYFENVYEEFQVINKMMPRLDHNPSLEKESHDECPICYTEMTNESMVKLGCAHSFCGDCIIGQIKSSSKTTSECAMCRATIRECSSASNELLQKMSSSIV